MMINAYNKYYLSDAQLLLGSMFDYIINDCKTHLDAFLSMFLHSSITTEIENGNPYYISGMSGIEASIIMLKESNPDYKYIEPKYKVERSKEYWAGWAIAYYQWHSSKRFNDIFKVLSLNELLNMYYVYHEMDIMRFVEELDERFNTFTTDTNLKRIRVNLGLSQNDLSKMSGVKLRSIQLYEQRVNDIDKAQSQTLYKLSKALYCNIEDLLEYPGK